MERHHTCVDGSIVLVKSEGDISEPLSSTADFRVKNIGVHRFINYGTGHLQSLREQGQASFPDWELVSEVERDIAGGTIAVGLIRQPTVMGESRFVRLAIWDGPGGCVQTSKTGTNLEAYADVLTQVPFRSSPEGAYVDAKPLVSPHPPLGLKGIDGAGVLELRPAIPEVLRKAPGQGGLPVRGGRMFKSADQPERRTVLHLLTDTAVARITLPRGARSVPSSIETLEVEWRAA